MEHDSITFEFRDDEKRMVRVVGREKGKTEVIDWVEETILHYALGLQMARIISSESSFTLKDLVLVRKTAELIGEMSK